MLPTCKRGQYRHPRSYLNQVLSSSGAFELNKPLKGRQEPCATEMGVALMGNLSAPKAEYTRPEFLN